MSNHLRHSYEHIERSPEHPFGDDSLCRIPFSNLLTDIVEHFPNGFVMAINGAWGTGKTVFLKQWRDVLELRGFRATILNAWDNDYFGEPTLAILSQFTDFFCEEHPLPRKAIGFWNTLQNVPAIVIKGFIHKQTSDFIGEDVVQELNEKYKNNSETGKWYRESDIGNYLQQRVDFVNYKNALIEFASAIAEEGKPLVFIIDELDRCTPPYAVEILEKIKHLFNIPNIIFCIAVDKEQLKQTIQGYYGSFRFNGEEYLRRFFDIELELPPIRYEVFSQLMIRHFELDKLIKSQDDLTEFVQISSQMSEKYHLTLRQLEKFFAHAKLVFSYYKAVESEWLVAIMLIIYKFNNELFLNIKDKTYSDIKDYASSLKAFFNLEEYSQGANKLGALLYHIDRYLKNGEINQIDENLKFNWTFDFSEKQLDTMLWCYKAEFQKRRQSISLAKIISKICFIEQFLSRP